MNPSAPAVDDAGGSTTAARLNGHSGAMPDQGMRADWARLPGYTVEVWLLGHHVATGVVDQASDDDSVLWLAGAGADTRRLFDKATGYQVWA